MRGDAAALEEEYAPRAGWAWVDDRGEPLAMGAPCNYATSSTGNSNACTQSAPHACEGLAAAQRSMAIWKRISPGMLPSTSRTPVSTAAEAFTFTQPGAAEHIDMTHHLRKTDFSAYTEAAVREAVQKAAARRK